LVDELILFGCAFLLLQSLQLENRYHHRSMAFVVETKGKWTQSI
jgi:hypothetical protein